MAIKGIYASEWEKFHPQQFVNIWTFEFDNRLVFWGTATTSDIPQDLADQDLDDFVLEPTDEIGNSISLAEAIALAKRGAKPC